MEIIIYKSIRLLNALKSIKQESAVEIQGNVIKAANDDYRLALSFDCKVIDDTAHVVSARWLYKILHAIKQPVRVRSVGDTTEISADRFRYTIPKPAMTYANLVLYTPNDDPLVVPSSKLKRALELGSGFAKRENKGGRVNVIQFLKGLIIMSHDTIISQSQVGEVPSIDPTTYIPHYEFKQSTIDLICSALPDDDSPVTVHWFNEWMGLECAGAGLVLQARFFEAHRGPIVFSTPYPLARLDVSTIRKRVQLAKTKELVFSFSPGELTIESGNVKQSIDAFCADNCRIKFDTIKLKSALVGLTGPLTFRLVRHIGFDGNPSDRTYLKIYCADLNVFRLFGV